MAGPVQKHHCHPGSSGVALGRESMRMRVSTCWVAIDINNFPLASDRTLAQ